MSNLNKLNEMLFEQLSVLDSDSVDLEKEIKRANAMSKISDQIIGIAKVKIQALQIIANGETNDNSKVQNIIG